MAIKDQIAQLITPTIETLGYELWAVTYVQGGAKTIKVYIDHEDGISLDDCSLVSGHVSAILDVEDPISTEYSLEVSSPGVERELFTLEHYQRYIDQEVQLKLMRPIEKNKKITGKISKVVEKSIYIIVENNELEVDFNIINKGNLVITW